MELTSKQRAQLRGMASTLDTIVHVGKNGIGENLIKQVNDALEARELIKGRVLENSMLTAREPAQGAEGIRRVALPPPLHLHVQHLCRAGQLRRGQRGHLQTLGGIGAALRQCLMRRDAGGDQQQKVQSQLLRRRLCRRDMAPVNGVKGPAVNTDLHITRSSSGP